MQRVTIPDEMKADLKPFDHEFSHSSPMTWEQRLNKRRKRLWQKAARKRNRP
jgi:hypothetical protein